MHRLKLLALKQREPIQKRDSVSFDDLVLADFAETLARIDVSERAVSVSVTPDISIEIKVPILAEASWAYHLTHLRCVLDQVVVGNDWAVTEACHRVMAAEGWVWGDHALKTPAWMIPAAEISYDDLDAHGFDWIFLA